MRIEIPEFCLVALVGATSCGKSSFAAKHFKPTEVLSSDFFRGLVSDDENNQECSSAAFDALYYVAKKRLDAMKLTVIDATHLQENARKQVLNMAREQNCHSVAIVFNIPESILRQRNAARPERQLPEHVIRRHCNDLRRCIRGLKKEGFRFVYVLNGVDEVDSAEIVRTKMWNDKREEHGPFDIIGDVHGCCDELTELLAKLGYAPNETGLWKHPEGRKAVFLGDLCDRGPRNTDTLKLVMAMVEGGTALCVPGNHDVKLVKLLLGKKVQRTHGLEKTEEELLAESEEFREKVKTFLDGLVSHYMLDGGKLAVAHAGIKEHYQGRGSMRIRDFCLYGETTGETDEYGLPVRLDWTSEYRGRALVAYGHIPHVEPEILNNTYGIDTGCVFGGKLTALRYPERVLVSVPAKAVYYEPARPLIPEAVETNDDLSLRDVHGRMHVQTRLMPVIDIREAQTAAALEVMSRFAADPHWLIYLPPTMSPCETAEKEDYLEYPDEAFAYYRKNGIATVVCEKKHMGSRCVIVLCRNRETAKQRFGVADGTRGILYTRTGRHFFLDESMEGIVLDRLDRVLTASNFWTDFKTDWVCLDTELMPWSEKAQTLLQRQYAPVGIAGRSGLHQVVAALESACGRNALHFQVDAATSGQNVDLSAVLDDFKYREDCLGRYTDAYRAYCWNVDSPDDLRIAPFHLLAVEGQVFTDRAHVWHMETIRKYMTGIDPVFMATEYRVVDVNDPASVQAGTDWWLALTGSGGEGMVVKPETYTALRDGELLQPAVKCRGREYLRIIYSPEYTKPEHLQRLKKRSLSRKRQLALREFALGVEGLERFVAKDSLYRVHQCAFGVLAFESEPVDPRL
ncbi:MAG: polynucleotide kinase-phosphatase [Oscillospiraceae bacterium]|nr:polynucleotide kinase-phosphatase [Oscillospiraceae bacterium]